MDVRREIDFAIEPRFDGVLIGGGDVDQMRREQVSARDSPQLGIGNRIATGAVRVAWKEYERLIKSAATNGAGGDKISHGRENALGCPRLPVAAPARILPAQMGLGRSYAGAAVASASRSARRICCCRAAAIVAAAQMLLDLARADQDRARRST